MMLRRVRLVIALAAVALALPLATARAAESGPVTGAWWQPEEPADGAIQPPESIPPGGLWAQNNTGGDAAVSAVRFNVGPNVLPQRLTLHVHQDQSQPAVVALDACPAANAWTPPKSTPGVFAERAIAACGRHRVHSSLSPDKKLMTFDLSQLPVESVIDLVLVRPTGTDSATFVDTTFEHPASQDLVTVAAVGSGPAPLAPSAEAAPSSIPTSPSNGDTSNAASAPADVGTVSSPESGSVGSSNLPSGPSLSATPPIAAQAADTPLAAGAIAGNTSVFGANRSPRSKLKPPGRDHAFYVAVAALAILLFWIAAIISQRFGTGLSGASTYTLYRGGPRR